MLQAFLPSMIEKNHGHIVALSSLAGLSGFENLVPYCASKFAVRGNRIQQLKRYVLHDHTYAQVTERFARTQNFAKQMATAFQLFLPID